LTAVACLRVAVDAERTGMSAATLGPLVAKFSTLYLESRWLWPRLFKPLTHYSYLLTDSRADELDPRELARMSDELQIKLFGAGAEGEVALLLFEGSPEAATAFAVMDTADLVAALRDPARLPAGGRLSRIVSPGAADRPAEVLRERPSESVDAEPDPESPADLVAEDTRALPALEGVQGVYFIPRGLFMGDVVSSTPGSARVHLSVVEGAEHVPHDPAAFDADCVIAAMRYLTEGARATLFLPVSYSNIVRASQRDAYAQILSVLPASRRNQLTASVYDTPRDPAFGALAQIRKMLDRYVANIDLQTHDPGFEIEKLTPQAVNSVTLVLPDVDARARLAVLRRFADRLDLYRRRQVWAGVTNVRNRTELMACVEAKVPFVTGAGVCRMQTDPMGGRSQPLDALPILAA
jgi:hypothetical protein